MLETAPPPPIEEPGIARQALSYAVAGAKRVSADAMTDWRRRSGPGQAEKLRDIPPEERTVKQGANAAVKAITDFFDGFLTKDLHSILANVKDDQDADRAFVFPQMEQLVENGEMSQTFYDVQVARERTMKGVRFVRMLLGKNQKSLQVNRAKTLFNMSRLTASQSPLAMHEDLMREGDTLAIGASLTGLSETIFDTIKRDKPEGDGPASARNSAGRRVAGGPAAILAGLIDEHAPGVSPDDITLAGELLAESGAVLVGLNPDHPVLGTAVFTGGSVLDFLDGKLAEFKGLMGKGMLKDLRADLRQQIVAQAVLSLIAMRRDNKVAAANYALATPATPLSSLARARAESMGLVVREGGVGTRASRGVLNGIGLGFNRYRDITDMTSGMLVVSTLNTVYERLDVIKHGVDSEYCVGVNNDPKFIKEAQMRERAILPYAIASAAVGAALLAANESGVVEERYGLKSAAPEAR